MGMSRKAQLIGAAVIVVVLVAAGLIALLARPDERSTDDIAGEIETWAADFTDAGDGPLDVMCPDPIEWRVGETFRCIVSQRETSVRVVVTMENDAGAYTFQAG